jgi:ATP-dependent RNA helicase DDX3X
MATRVGGSWKHRQDGRRPGSDDKTELEVFGEVKRSTAGIDFDKYEAIPVQITGTNVENIKPIDRFSEAGLSDELFDNLRRCGYDRPTPVQKNSIPIVLSGRDLMACAQTGSGKTCAFMVPCLESLMRSGPPADTAASKRKAMPCGLVLAPTRELAAQIHVEASKFAYDSGIKCCIIYGGADMRDQRNELDRGCDILVATPGRLEDMAGRSYISLEFIQFFILDEADRMLDMGFEPQVRTIVSNLGMGKRSTHPRQSMMFSATFAREVQVMAQDFLNDYVFITVGRVGSASELISQQVVYSDQMRQKVHALERAIKENLTKDGLAVVFVETKRSADDLELELHGAGVAVTAIHGDRSQNEREEALNAFKSGANPVLVATDVAARGLDIPNVALVVNFDMPKQLDDYVHRIGRTGRAGRKGVAVSFVNERCTYLPELGDLLVEAKQEPPAWFGELCRNASRRTGGKGKGAGRGNKFGGQDLRMEQAAGETPGSATDSKAAPLGVATPARGQQWTAAPARNSNAWGNSGAEDAW